MVSSWCVSPIRVTDLGYRGSDTAGALRDTPTEQCTDPIEIGLAASCARVPPTPRDHYICTRNR